MPLTLTRNKNYLFNYNTLKQKYQEDLQEYYSSIAIFNKFKDKIGEESFNFITKTLHPLNDYVAMRNALEMEFKFYSWVVKNYPLSAEKKMKFEVGKNVIKKALTSYGRLLSSLKEKWSK
jgi:hypothetical protein